MNTHPVNLLIRFLLELAMLAVFAIWGYRHFPGWQGITAAIILPVVAATLWGVFRIPNDPRPAPVAIPGPLRLLLEGILFGGTVWALEDLGYDTWAWLMAGILVAHYLVSYDRTATMLRNRPYKGFAKCLGPFAIGLTFLFATCTTSVTKTKNPEFSIPMASLARQIDSLVPGGHKNLIGRSITTNGKDSSVLEVDIINGRDIPKDDTQKKELGRSIAAGIHNALKDKNEYKAFSVVFVKVDSGSVVTKKTWNGFTYPASNL